MQIKTSEQAHRPLVFVVDDEETLRLSIDRFLSRHGFDVKGLANGYEALYMMEHVRPDVVITDLRMPKVDGLKLCRTMHSQDATRDVPIICMTGIHDDRLIQAAERLGIEYFLLKPFPLDLLLNTLRYVLSAAPSDEVGSGLSSPPESRTTDATPVHA